MKANVNPASRTKRAARARKAVRKHRARDDYEALVVAATQAGEILRPALRKVMPRSTIHVSISGKPGGRIVDVSIHQQGPDRRTRQR